ncbi:MAG: hypothetical protein Q8Q09_24865 [Deltaproteobacteria bacterium]|nr:hypothetical protein [Deltaproteobacteria bacterium]
MSRTRVASYRVITALSASCLALSFSGVSLAQQDGGAAATDASAAPPARPQVEIAPDAAAYTGPAPYFNIGQPRVGAGVTPSAMQRAITRQKAPLVDCYKRLLLAQNTAAGRLELRFEVIAGGSGLLDRVSLSPHRNNSFETCVRNAFGNLTWPSPRGAPSVSVVAEVEMAPLAPAPTGRRR